MFLLETYHDYFQLWRTLLLWETVLGNCDHSSISNVDQSSVPKLGTAQWSKFCWSRCLQCCSTSILSVQVDKIYFLYTYILFSFFVRFSTKKGLWFFVFRENWNVEKFPCLSCYIFSGAVWTKNLEGKVTSDDNNNLIIRRPNIYV